MAAATGLRRFGKRPPLGSPLPIALPVTRKKGSAPRRILAGSRMLVSSGIGYTPALATFEGRFFKRYFPELRVYDLAAPTG